MVGFGSRVAPQTGRRVCRLFPPQEGVSPPAGGDDSPPPEKERSEAI